MKTLIAFLTAMTMAISAALPALADEVEIRMVQAMQSNGLWKFEITVSHPDTGADHMYSSVAIFTPDETQIGSADVPMPSIGADHVTTQVLDVDIPEDVEYILIRGKCSDYGWTHEGIVIALR